MSAFIWRLGAIGIGKETVSWTAVAPTMWIPFESGEVKPVIETIKDTGAYGVIDETYDSKVVKNMSETVIAGIVRDDFIWDLLMWVLGVSTAPVETETDVHFHEFARKNDNTPVTYTTYYDNPVGDEEATYCAFDNLGIEVNSGDYVKFSTTLKGKALATPWTDRTPAYTDQQEFLAANATIKFADDIAWLDAASAVELKNIKFDIAKNVIDYQAIWNIDVASMHNQQFNVSWDLEALFSDVVLRNYVLNNTKKAMSIQILSSNLIGATEYSQLNFEFARISFNDWGKSTDANGLVMQTMGFDAEFSATDSKTISASIQNNNAVQY